MEKLINDHYRRVRGGKSRLLGLSCSSCETAIMSYQKDGPGILKRLYLDRISDISFISPMDLVSSSPNIPTLICPNCHKLLGFLHLYAPENRWSFRLFVGAVSKKIKKI